MALPANARAARVADARGPGGRGYYCHYHYILLVLQQLRVVIVLVILVIIVIIIVIVIVIVIIVIIIIIRGLARFPRAAASGGGPNRDSRGARRPLLLLIRSARAPDAPWCGFGSRPGFRNALTQ